MTWRVVLVLMALLVAAEMAANAELLVDPHTDLAVQRHHYAISARVRPLLLFRVSRRDIGDAVASWRRGPSEAAYSLLIGSDPRRAPRRINRWGFIDEHIRGGDATLLGLMTASDEDSIEEAETSIRKQAGDRTFKIIRATISGEQARSVVTSIDAPAEYSFHELAEVLGLAQRETGESKARVIHLPPGTRPGFLAAVAELMHRHVTEWQSSGRVHPGPPVPFVYRDRIYELAAMRTHQRASAQLGGRLYTNVIASDFEIRNTRDGELTPFSMTYGASGPLAETPLSASYQPRWWLEIELSLDDSSPGPSLATGLSP